MYEERTNKHGEGEVVKEGAVPPYLLDRQHVSRAKVLSNMIKQKRKEKAGKWEVPLPKVRPISEDEMFKVIKTGKKRSTFHSLSLILSFSHSLILSLSLSPSSISLSLFI
jgi:ribosome biogenesis protein NSA2